MAYQVFTMNGDYFPMRLSNSKVAKPGVTLVASNGSA